MAVLNERDWVMTKSKRIGVIGWWLEDGHAYLLFPDGHSRSYKPDGLVKLEPSMCKLLTAVNTDFWNDIAKRFWD